MTNKTNHGVKSYDQLATSDKLDIEMPELIKSVQRAVIIRRAAYDESIKQGFTAEQALVLCQQPFIIPK